MDPKYSSYAESINLKFKKLILYMDSDISTVFPSCIKLFCLLQQNRHYAKN